ncbi:glycosyltransferase [Halospina sp. K52047b]|uniref:glycosyltransferase n=1 Tax=Halospina sp. K52047b TaxID=2614160 RepID=UPI001787CBAA|nr:glycosyltransferase [Halospina sp. K52047b]
MDQGDPKSAGNEYPERGFRIVFLCDQTVDLHFPPHFGQVYLYLLPKLGCDVSLGAFSRNQESSVAREVLASGRARLFRKRANTLFGRILLACATPFLVGRWFRKTGLAHSDIIVVHNDPVLAWTAWFLTRRTGAAFVYRITHLVPESIIASGGLGQRTVAKLAMIARNLLLRRSDAVIPMSKAMADYFADKVGLSGDAMKPVESMVRVDELPTATEPQCSGSYERVKQELESRTCTRWLVYIGTLDPQRRPSFLLDTLGELRRNDPSVGLLVLGVTRSAWQLDVLRRYAREQKLEDYVVWSEPVPDDCLPAVLTLTDIGLSPLPIDEILRTNSPVKTMDYIRGHIPVVASAIPDNQYVLEESGGGVIAEYNPTAFASAAYKLLSESKEQRDERVARSVIWLRDNRDLNVAAEKLLEVFQLALKRRASEE